MKFLAEVVNALKLLTNFTKNLQKTLRQINANI